jgi:excisionase family DNA binding protein
MKDQLLKANDVAARLNISRSAAFSLMRSGDLSVVRFGRLVRVRSEDLEAFISQNTINGSPFQLNTNLSGGTERQVIDLATPSKKGHYQHD